MLDLKTALDDRKERFLKSKAGLLTKIFQNIKKADYDNTFSAVVKH